MKRLEPACAGGWTRNSSHRRDFSRRLRSSLIPPSLDGSLPGLVLNLPGQKNLNRAVGPPFAVRFVRRIGCHLIDGAGRLPRSCFWQQP